MEDNTIKLLGERIRELRKSKHYTQDRFSELLGIDPKHLSRIECGKTQPSLNLIRKMAFYLGVEVSKLLETEHLEDKGYLIEEINKVLENSIPEKIRLYYKILKTIEN